MTYQLPPHCQRMLTRLAEAVTMTITRLAAAARTLWQNHDELMHTNGPYLAVVTSLAGLLAQQLDLERLVLAVVSALIRHLTRTSRQQPEIYGYPDLDGWTS